MQPARSIKIGWILMLILGLYRIVMSAIAVTIGGMNIFTGILLATIAAAIIGISLGSYRKAERWSWWCLLVIGFAPLLGSTTYIDVVTIEITGVLVGWVLFIVALIIPAKAILSKQPAATKPRNLETPRVQPKHEWWRSKWIWVVIIIILGVVVFGIIQPFMWKLAYKESPPSSTTDLSNLLTIVLALFALGAAAFGGGVYYILSHRLQEDARKAAEKEYRITFARLLTHTSSLYGRMFESLNQLPSIPRYYLTPLLDMAVRWGKEASECAERLDKETQARLIIAAKNNHAMALALKGDKTIAKEQGIENIIHYVEKELPKYPLETNVTYSETIAFARWRLPRSQEDIKQGRNTLNQLLQNPNIDELTKERWQKRWEIFQKGTI